MGIREGSKLLHHSEPFDTSERLVRCTVGQQRQVGNGSDAPACEGRAFLDGENRDGTARQIPSSNACQRSAAMTMTTAKTRSAARPQTPTRNLRTEGAGTPSSGGGRGSGCRQIRHHWAEGVATPFSSGGSSCVNEYVAQLPFQRRQRLSANT